MSTQSTTEVGTVSDSGQAVPARQRFKDADSMLNCYQRLFDEDNGLRARKRASIQGLKDGNPIYSDSELRRDGQGWRSNFNPRTAESIHNSNSASLWSLMFSTEHLMQIKPKSQIDLPPDQIAEQCGIIAEEFSNVHMQSADFLPARMCVTNDIVDFGVGWLFRLDQFDWRSTYVQHGAVKYPPRMSIFSKDYTVFFVEDTLPLSKLMDMANDEEFSKYGWKAAEIKKTIIRRYAPKQNPGTVNPRKQKYDKSEWESVQQQTKNNDLGNEFGDMEGLAVVWAFVVDPKTNGVSLFCVENAQPVAGEQRDYLYMKADFQPGIENCCCPFYYNTGDGYMRSIKGQLWMIYPQLVTQARMINALADAVMLSATVFWKDVGQSAGRMRKIGPVTQIPAGAEPVNSAFAPRFDGLIQFHRMMDVEMNQNAGVYKKTLEQQGNRTAEEVRAEVDKDARLETFQAMIFYMHCDRDVKETFRRLVNPDYPKDWPGYKEAAEFKKNCLKRGVDKRLLDSDNVLVRSVRAMGLGSATMARQIGQRLQDMAKEGAFDTIGTREAVRNVVAQLVGWDEVDRFAPKSTRDEIPTNETSIAAMEDNDIRAGLPVKVGVDQNHLLHADSVLRNLSQLAQMYMAGQQGQAQPINPMQVMAALSIGLPHLQEHLDLAGRNPAFAQKVKPMQEAAKQLEQFAKKVQQDVQKMQQQMQEQAAQEQENPPLSPEERAELRKDAIAKKQIERSDALAIADKARRDFKVESDAVRKDRVAAHKAGMDERQAQSAPFNGGMPVVPTQGEM
jgi:hypothetical protein